VRPLSDLEERRQPWGDDDGRLEIWAEAWPPERKTSNLTCLLNNSELNEQINQRQAWAYLFEGWCLNRPPTRTRFTYQQPLQQTTTSIFSPFKPNRPRTPRTTSEEHGIKHAIKGFEAEPKLHSPKPKFWMHLEQNQSPPSNIIDGVWRTKPCHRIYRTQIRLRTNNPLRPKVVANMTMEGILIQIDRYGRDLEDGWCGGPTPLVTPLMESATRWRDKELNERVKGGGGVLDRWLRDQLNMVITNAFIVEMIGSVQNIDEVTWPSRIS